jgi:hypothetical protein
MARPSKYQETFNKQAYKLALLGAKDKELATFFEVDEATINRWKIDYPEFCESLKAGKEIADMKVSKSLYKRALGFKYDEVTHERVEVGEFNPQLGEFVKVPATKTKVVTKYIIPDTTAQIFWLKNRQSAKWRDKQEVQHSGEITTITGMVVK